MKDRFEVREKLGSGSMGVVYRAYDRERRREVALKTLRHVDGRQLYRFKKEFRSLSDLVHPNLVALHELISIGDKWCFTMELVDGISFLEYVRPRRRPGGAGTSSKCPYEPSPAEQVLDSLGPLSADGTQTTADVAERPQGRRKIGGTVNLERLREALSQLTAAVEALHRAGRLHRDLKPSNVLVTPAGRLVLCDFGLIADVAHPDRTLGTGFAGTPSYMSPEQAGSRHVTEASDWYGVGVMLYEALTGRLPFSGSTNDVLRQKRRRDPPRPRELVASVHPRLDRLCMRLLRRDPKRRANGDAIRSALGIRPPRVVQAEGAPVFVGRSMQLAALHDAARTVRGGHCVAVLVEGCSGIGKTALVRKFLADLAEKEDALVLEGRCYQRESVPFKALDTLVDALSGHLLRVSEAALGDLIPRDIGPLSRLFPVLRVVPEVAEPQVLTFEPPDPQELRRRGFGALRFLLARLAARRLVVLSIDDLQWGDVDSARFLSELVHHPLAPAILLLTAYRSEDRRSSACLRTFLQKSATGVTGDIRVLELEPLPLEDARALVSGILGAEADESVERIVRDSDGGPLFLSELAHARRSRGAPEDVSLEQLLRRRIEELPTEARALLTTIAVAGRPIRLRIASRAADIRNEATALTVLSSERLVRVAAADGNADEIIEPYHDRIGEVATGCLGEADVRRVHRQLALTLEATERFDVIELVEHWLAAGDLQRASCYTERAGVRADGSFAFHLAAHYYRLALELAAPVGQHRRALLARIGDALTNAGCLADAAEAYLAAAAEAEPAEALELRRRAVEQLLRAGRREEGLASTRALLTDVGLAMPSSARRAFIAVAVRRLWIRLRGLGFKPRSPDEILPRDLRRIEVSWSLSSGLSLVDPLLGTVFQMKHLLTSLSAGHPRHVALALSLEVAYGALSGVKTSARAERISGVARALAERHDDVHALGVCWNTSGIASFLCGRWKDARERLERGEKILRDQCKEVTWEIDVGQLFHLAALLYLGDIAELSRRVPLYLREALDRGDEYLASGVRSWRSNVAWLALDAPQEARRQVEEATAELREDAFHLRHYYQLLSHVQIDLYSDEGAEAWQRLEGIWHAFERSHLLRIQTVRIEGRFLRARAALAAAQTSENPPRMLGIALSCARAIRREKTAWGSPLAKLIIAGEAALRGDVGAASTALGVAADEFDAADMGLLAAVARRRQGLLLRGDVGRSLLQQSDAWMARQGIRSPERMTAMYAPGFVDGS